MGAEEEEGEEEGTREEGEEEGGGKGEEDQGEQAGWVGTQRDA